MPADVVISGAGPNGLMMACELALAGIKPVLLDALPGPGDEPKAVFALVDGDKAVEAYAYCNLHGLWKATV